MGLALIQMVRPPRQFNWLTDLDRHLTSSSNQEIPTAFRELAENFRLNVAHFNDFDAGILLLKRSPCVRTQNTRTMNTRTL